MKSFLKCAMWGERSQLALSMEDLFMCMYKLCVCVQEAKMLEESFLVGFRQRRHNSMSTFCCRLVPLRVSLDALEVASSNRRGPWMPAHLTRASPAVFSFCCSCFPNSQTPMSYFPTWILLTYQAIAMMTFSLFLRTTEAFCISLLTPFDTHRPPVASQARNLKLLFPTRTSSPLERTAHTPSFLPSGTSDLLESQVWVVAVERSKRDNLGLTS